MKKEVKNQNDRNIIRQQFKKKRLGMAALVVFILFCLIGIYAPLLASSKPLFVIYDGNAYFPLFRYLFYMQFYTKPLDIFFNLLMFSLPLFIFAMRRGIKGIAIVLAIHTVLFIYLISKQQHDPANNPLLSNARQKFIETAPYLTWKEELRFMNDYGKLNLVLRTAERKKLDEELRTNPSLPQKSTQQLASLWELEIDREKSAIIQEQDILARNQDNTTAAKATARLNYILDRRYWLNEQIPLLHTLIMPLVTPYHWEDDAGGQQSLNQLQPWWKLTRINKKDLTAALIFGMRISLTVGVLSVGLALLIGIPIGAIAGYYGGRVDIIISRLLEIWESMPTFFMLLMVIAITQSKSIFLVIGAIGIFGWTGFTRYIRGEVFKQRNLLYVEACKAIGFNESYIVFSHILPNAIPPVLTILPFAMMGAIASEAGLSFLGLGEEGSTSWGVLMDEGRSAFPSEGYLLWPPAILLTILLVAIALIGDSLRDALDPKMHK